MLRIMLQKLWHKKWMNMCLLLGSILLIATVVSFPLYQTAAYDRMLQDEFKNYVSTEGKWPALTSYTTVSKKDAEGTAIRRMEEWMQNICGEFGVTPKETIIYYQHSPVPAVSTMNREDMDDVQGRLGSLNNLKEHASLLSGEMFSETGITPEGEIEVVVSQAGMVNMQVLVGETVELNGLKNADNKNIKVKVVGVIGMEDYSDFYWQVKPDDMTNTFLMDMDLFKEMFTGTKAKKYSITCNYYSLFEYEDLRASQVEHLAAATTYLTEESSYRATVKSANYQQILENYQRKQGRIQATLMILQIPVLIMLAAFLFMISTQMYDMERNEISVIKSRGSSGAQIFRLYLYQSLFLSIVGGAAGIPLGMVFSRILGSARNFLEFDSTRALDVHFTLQTAIYAAAAMGATLIIMACPAIKHSRVTIVNLKQQKALKKKSFWEIIFLDVILLGISLYGYYSFRKSSADLAKSVLMGESLDPLLYISSSLFIVGMGLLFLRLQPIIVQGIYLVGKNFWKPASYASFMENRKNGKKQQFIMLFLIMTISLGMYHATVARTILQNAQDNTTYLDGADIIIRETWDEIIDHGVATGDYIEPDYSKYAKADFIRSYTRVLYDDKAVLHTSGSNADQRITLTAIHTKNFGEITSLDRSLTSKHFYEYLNELAVEANGVLVSDNFRTKLGMKEGDSINYVSKGGKTMTGKIVDFVEYWPGYAPTTTDLNPDGSISTEDNYLVITHYDMLRQKWGATPYEVWIQLKSTATGNDVVNWIQDNEVHVTKYVDRASDVKSTVEDPLLQGTNGVLTMGFIVTILLCGVGYLIYWIMSIRSREMIFGVLRACGMHKGELFQMLMNEQIFSGVFSVLAGIGIGKLASSMFVPMLQQAYAAANQVLPMKLIVNSSDMLRLYIVIAAVMVICLAILITLLFKLNVAKALKLGEE